MPIAVTWRATYPSEISGDSGHFRAVVLIRRLVCDSSDEISWSPLVSRPADGVVVPGQAPTSPGLGSERSASASRSSDGAVAHGQARISPAHGLERSPFVFQSGDGAAGHGQKRTSHALELGAEQPQDIRAHGRPSRCTRSLFRTCGNGLLPRRNRSHDAAQVDRNQQRRSARPTAFDLQRSPTTPTYATPPNAASSDRCSFPLGHTDRSHGPEPTPWAICVQPDWTPCRRRLSGEPDGVSADTFPYGDGAAVAGPWRRLSGTTLNQQSVSWSPQPWPPTFAREPGDTIRN